MKTTSILGLAILIVVILASILVIAAFNQPLQPTGGVNPLALQSKVVMSQTGKDLSEVGSTTGIAIMGIAITLIVTIPLFFRKKR